MPLYSYKCCNCGREFDRLRKAEDADSLTCCPDCLSLADRIVAVPNFHKGDGYWADSK